jgi:hypothetical protein
MFDLGYASAVARVSYHGDGTLSGYFLSSATCPEARALREATVTSS